MVLNGRERLSHASRAFNRALSAWILGAFFTAVSSDFGLRILRQPTLLPRIFKTGLVEQNFE